MRTTDFQSPGLCILFWSLAAPVLVVGERAWAAELSDDLRLDVVATGVYQLGDYDDAIGNDGSPLHHEAKGSLAVDVAAEYDPTEQDTLYSLVSFARGNGLKGLGGVSLQVNADDLEDDVTDINGTNRNYLLEAWYRRTIDLDQDDKLSLTGGLLDATRYIDHNRIANDEIEQFMNEAFVTRFFLPSYDPGVAVGVRASAWHVDLVWMNAKTGPKKEGGVEYDFFGADLGIPLELPFGEGNCHLIAETSSKEFADRDKASKLERLNGFGISAAQSFGDRLTVFSRIAWFNEDASIVDHRALYTGGAQVPGNAFGLPSLVWGIAYGYLPGAGIMRGDIRKTQVFESYGRLTLNRYSDLSVDLQYVGDKVYGDADPSVWVLGIRLNATY